MMNSKEVWDKVWNDPSLNTEDSLTMAQEASSKRWIVVSKILTAHFGSLSNKSVIEIGSGKGTFSALLGKIGARVTLLDYSTAALNRAKSYYKNNNLQATVLCEDAKNLSSATKRLRFDVSISVGVAEHFESVDRDKILRLHLDFLKPGGIAIIIVPNKRNIPYRIYKFLSEVFNTWKFGAEYPFSSMELNKFASRNNCQVLALFGDELYESTRFFLPANKLRRLFKVDSPLSLNDIRFQRGSFLDDAFGYALTLVIKKKNEKS